MEQPTFSCTLMFSRIRALQSVGGETLRKTMESEFRKVQDELNELETRVARRSVVYSDD
jgi:hypothetical protein